MDHPGLLSNEATDKIAMVWGLLLTDAIPEVMLCSICFLYMLVVATKGEYGLPPCGS